MKKSYEKKRRNPNPSPTGKIWFGFLEFGAPGGSRTRTRRQEPKSCVSANSTTGAIQVFYNDMIFLREQVFFLTVRADSFLDACYFKLFEHAKVYKQNSHGPEDERESIPCV